MKAVWPPTQRRSEQGNAGFVCIRKRCRAVTATARHDAATLAAFSAPMITEQALWAPQSQNGLRNRVTIPSLCLSPASGSSLGPGGSGSPARAARRGQVDLRSVSYTAAACTRNTARAALGECQAVKFRGINTNFIPFLTPDPLPPPAGGCVSPSNAARILRFGAGHVMCSHG